MPSKITTQALIDALSFPEAYPRGGDDVTRLETHISLLFICGAHVYKVKKPVNLGFLDFSTLERRRRFCEEEVRLNRRLAPTVYEGVIPIVRDERGVMRLVHEPGASDEIVEYAVEMKKLPQSQMLDAHLDRGEIDNQQLNDLVDLLADFHRNARTGDGVDEHGEPEAIRRMVEENFTTLRPSDSAGIPGISPVLSPRLYAYLWEWAQTSLEAHRELFRSRVRRHRIREGHGDLHTGNICIDQDGIFIYDCIEFSARYRCCDVASDIAFLAMDLDLRGFRAFGSYLFYRYSRVARDIDIARLANFYKSYRAMVRAKVAWIRAQESEAKRRSSLREAKRYTHLAASYALQNALVLMCGLPASGKSWAARSITRSLGGVVIRSDAVRKQIHGPSDDGGHHLYQDTATEHTYRQVLSMARTELTQHRHLVVCDATFRRRADRAQFMALAAESATPVTLVHISCSEATIRERMSRRAQDSREVSDADFSTYKKLKPQFELPTEIPRDNFVDIDDETSPEELVAAVLESLISQAPLDRR